MTDHNWSEGLKKGSAVPMIQPTDLCLRDLTTALLHLNEALGHEEISRLKSAASLAECAGSTERIDELAGAVAEQTIPKKPIPRAMFLEKINGLKRGINDVLGELGSRADQAREEDLKALVSGQVSEEPTLGEAVVALDSASCLIDRIGRVLESDNKRYFRPLTPPGTGHSL